MEYRDEITCKLWKKQLLTDVLPLAISSIQNSMNSSLVAAAVRDAIFEMTKSVGKEPESEFTLSPANNEVVGNLSDFLGSI